MELCCATQYVLCWRNSIEGWREAYLPSLLSFSKVHECHKEAWSQVNTGTERTNLGLQDYLSIIARRRHLLIIVAALILLSGMALSLLLPAIYRSEAVILIEQQEIPTELVRSTVTSFADQRIQVISQRVMTSSNLTEIIEKYGLYIEESETEPREVIIEMMRNDVVRDMISADVVDPRSGRPTEATIAFRLAYRSKSPQLAQRVANELVSLYLNENIKSRTESAKETASFLTEEADRLGKRVSELEAELAKFKEENVENRPELEELTRALMNRTDLEIAELDRRMHSATQQKIYLEGELGQLEPFRNSSMNGGLDSPAARLEQTEAALTAAEASYAESHPDVVRLRKQVKALRDEVDPAAAREIAEAQLSEARATLADVVERYATDHPDVLTARRAVESLENKLQSLPKSGEKPRANNPAYVAMDARLEAINAELSSLREQRVLLSQKYEKALTNLMQMPEAEVEYRKISREYENTVAKYREVNAKQMEARLSENLEAERKGERFTLIEPPLLPEQPASPNRLAIIMVSFLLAMLGGFGTVGIAEAMDTKVRGRQGVQQILTAPPLAAIPYIYADGEKRRTRSPVKFFVTVMLVVIVAGLIAFHFAIKPLDVTWFILLRKLGL